MFGEKAFSAIFLLWVAVDSSPAAFAGTPPVIPRGITLMRCHALLKGFDGSGVFSRKYDGLSIESFLKIAASQLLDVKRIKIPNFSTAGVATEEGFSGYGFFRIEKGTFNGNDVFIKYANRKSSLPQLKLYKFLGDFGIGPKLYGITYDAKGRLGIVMEYVDGIHVDERTRQIPKNVRISMATYNALWGLKAALVKLGLVYGTDLQLRFSLDGKVFLVDPEQLQFVKFLPGQGTTGIEFDEEAKKFYDVDLTKLPDEALMEPLIQIDRIMDNVMKMLHERGAWAPAEVDESL